MKYLVLIAFIGILASLASALYFMMRGGRNDASETSSSSQRSKGNYMVKALAVRVGLSVILFLCILIAWKLGYVQPSGLPVSR
ncbi:MAG: twin transmembrane helix small protein [Burkholderiaceae bacterium]|nr:twin transmembrane helix small protein [Burkholderiaceae bacterium]